jgi:hypothetical protein
MINRKLWSGDALNLAEGNSFWGLDQVVRHRAGLAIVAQESEPGDPLVEITGGYTVKREDLSELSPQQGEAFNLIGQLGIPEALNGIGSAERMMMVRRLEELEYEQAERIKRELGMQLPVETEISGQLITAMLGPDLALAQVARKIYDARRAGDPQPKEPAHCSECFEGCPKCQGAPRG